MESDEFIEIVNAVADGLFAAGVTFQCLDKMRRRLGQDGFDRVCVIDPKDPHRIIKAVGWMTAQGSNLVLSYLEFPNGVDVFSSSITQRTKIPSARGVNVFSVIDAELVGRIDILFKVEPVWPDRKPA